MRNDLDLIVKRFPNTKKWNTLRLYAIGDVHVGAENFDEKAIKKKIEIIASVFRAIFLQRRKQQ